MNVRDETGMTLVEVMVAALVLVVGVLALMTVFTSSAKLTTTSERESQATDYAQRQVELVRALPYASIALSQCTSDTTWTKFKTASDPAYIAPLATETAVTPCTGGKVAPVSAWQDDRLSVRGTVYRYVTRMSAYVKRITVAVTTTGAGALSRPVAVSTLVADPTVGTSGGTLITGGGSPCFVIGLVCLS